MGEMLDTVLHFFEQDGWPLSLLSDGSILEIGFQGENGQWTCMAQVREEQAQFLFYSICPVVAPRDRRLAVAEFLTRANYGMLVGNFELDFNDGEIRYKTSIDVGDGSLSTALVQQMVYANVQMMDYYLPGILMVMFGQVSPAEVIDEIEGTSSS
jgi:hypothetical protein